MMHADINYSTSTVHKLTWKFSRCWKVLKTLLIVWQQSTIHITQYHRSILRSIAIVSGQLETVEMETRSPLYKTTSVQRPHNNYVPKMTDKLIQRPPLYKDHKAKDG